MKVIRINAITVPESGGEELTRRFAERAGAVNNADGFEPLVRVWASSPEASGTFGANRGRRRSVQRVEVGGNGRDDAVQDRNRGELH
jgi:hypothetical protein